MVELSAVELADLRERLTNQNWVKRMQQLQKIVCDEFESFREHTETLTVRAVIPRTQLKQFGKVVAKIERNREDGSHGFSFDDVDDVVGIKVLCPYSSDVDRVIEWTLGHWGFDVRPREPEQARRRRQAGYRGYHFTVRLTGEFGRRHADLLGLRCEVQVKTMLEEAWDAKTHHIQYRREHHINPTLTAQMKLLSDALEVVDRQSELLKQQIIETEFEENKRKAGVVQVYLRSSHDEIKSLVDQGRISTDVLSAKIGDRDASILAEHVSQNRGPGKISPSVCRLAAILALQVRGQRFDVVSGDVCDEYVRSRPSDPRAHLLKASICWALDNLEDAISSTERAVALAEEQHSEDVLAEAKSNLAYWLAEEIWVLRRRNQRVPDDLVATALAHIRYALERSPESAAFLDTHGFLLIAAGANKDEVEQGRQYLRKALALASTEGEEAIASAFYARHERIGLRRLLDLS